MFPLGAAVNQYPAAGRYDAAVVGCDGVKTPVTAAVTTTGDGDGEIVLEGWDVADGLDGDDVCVEFVGPRRMCSDEVVTRPRGLLRTRARKPPPVSFTPRSSRLDFSVCTSFELRFLNSGPPLSV